MHSECRQCIDWLKWEGEKRNSLLTRNEEAEKLWFFYMALLVEIVECWVSTPLSQQKSDIYVKTANFRRLQNLIVKTNSGRPCKYWVWLGLGHNSQGDKITPIIKRRGRNQIDRERRAKKNISVIPLKFFKSQTAVQTQEQNYANVKIPWTCIHCTQTSFQEKLK